MIGRNPYEAYPQKTTGELVLHLLTRLKVNKTEEIIAVYTRNLDLLVSHTTGHGTYDHNYYDKFNSF